MKKCAVIGHFGDKHIFLDGQTVKTKTVTSQLEKAYGADQVLQYDTYGGKKILFKLMLAIISVLRKSENVVILPAQNGLRFIAPLLVEINRFFRRKLHYVVIGGWLPQMLERRRLLSSILKRFDYIYVETSVMKDTLEARGFRNIEILPNCKDIQPMEESELIYPSGIPYHLCTFSRVMKEKGIEDAVNAVCTINEKMGRTIYTLDIYGQVDGSQERWFSELSKRFPPYITYQGTVDFDKSVNVIKNYFALLFPTHFYTEGIPGTIIDAYAAGVPVITSKWESFSDIVIDDVTGFGYNFERADGLRGILERLAKEPGQCLRMKKNCLSQAKKYRSEYVSELLIANM